MNKTIFILSFIFLVFQSTICIATSDDYFDRGMDYIKLGEFEKAVNLWIEARDNLNAKGKADFRIGVKFIEHVTENRAEHLYPVASKMYYWGLSSDTIGIYLDYVKKEIQMLEPIVPNSTYAKWIELVNNDSAKVLTEIKAFWVSKDPSVSTTMNERLIEHWERISYARENYTKVKSSVYDTDDRGLIYIKYGEPDRLEEGKFTLNSGRVQQWISETLEHQDRRMEDYNSDFFVDNAINTSDDFVSNEIYKKNLSKRLSDKFLLDFGHVEYLIWIYDKEEVYTTENLIFFFGQLRGNEAFGLVDGPEDLITQRNFRQRDIGGTRYRFNFGPISQLSFYDNLKFVDDYFLDSYNELQDNLFNDPEITGESSSDYLRTKYINQMNSVRSAAKEALSIYDRELFSFNLLHKQARFLDDNNQPYEVYLIYSEPQNALINDYNRFTSEHEDAGEPEYRIQHSLVLFDSDYNSINSAHDFPDLTFQKYQFIDEYIRPISIFKLPVTEQNFNSRIEARLFNISYDNQTEVPQRSNENRLPQELIGTVSMEITYTEPLNKHSLELSDIILCYEYDLFEDEDVEHSTEDNTFFPCYVPFEMTISNSEDLNFYFEIYNLETNEENRANFMIDYETRAIEQSRGFFSRLFGRGDKNPTSITLNYEINGNRTEEHLMVDLSDYAPGTYELTLTIKDGKSEKVVSRSKKFTVVNN